MRRVHIIDVKSGNLRSLTNSIQHLGDYEIVYIRDSTDFEQFNHEIENLVFPGVGNFGHFVTELNNRGLLSPIRNYLSENRKLLGICVGLQSLFESSEESISSCGLNILNFRLTKFNRDDTACKNQIKSVPHIGWSTVNDISPSRKSENDSRLFGINTTDKYYFVHSYAAIINSKSIDSEIAAAESAGWRFAFSTYGSERFISAISKGNFFATQFHPEKSGVAGLRVIKAFLEGDERGEEPPNAFQRTSTFPSKRIIACLDVRTNDDGDLVVTKGDQYDVREKSDSQGGQVRNLGKPVDLAYKYYLQGADEITFLNITSFRESPLKDLPMLEVLQLAAKKIFVPLTVGGGIKDMIDPETSELVPAAKVAELYFSSGADKVSLGSEAVVIAEQYYKSGRKKSGLSAIEQISTRFGNQAVVISIDPKRKYLSSAQETFNEVIKIDDPDKFGPNGEEFCYYQVTSRGGRMVHDLGALEVCMACEDLGAGEILLNSIDHDGSNIGFNLELLKQVKQRVSIPVIASSGAGRPEHFGEVFELDCEVDAALGAGMFHRGDYEVNDVKRYLIERGMDVRMELNMSVP